MLLKQNVLGQDFLKNEKPGICRSIVSLRNLPMMDYVVKDVGHLKAADLKLDFEVAQNRVFIAELLKIQEIPGFFQRRKIVRSF